MNKVQLIGRLTKDPEIKMTSNQTKFCQFTLAVDRRFKDANGQRQADFISCLAWRQTAEFIAKYFKKGNRIGVVGNIQIRSYDDQNGQKRFVTEVVIDEAEFVESSTKNENTTAETNTGFVDNDPVQSEAVGESVSGVLPFEI
jgi:single-strand DNA-binding protein